MLSQIAVAAVLLSLLTGAGGPPPAWQIPINLSSMPGHSTYTTLVRNPATGDLWAAWTDAGVAAREEVLVRRWSVAAGGWLPAENLSASPEWARDGGPALIFDASGQGLLIWTRTYSAYHGAPADGHDVLWRRWDGTTWSPEQVLLHQNSYLPGSPGTYHLIPVQLPSSVLLFINWDNTYNTAEYQAGTWSPLSPVVVLDVKLADIVAGPDGTLHAVAYGDNSAQWGNNFWFYDAYYVSYSGGGWSESLNLSSTQGVAGSVGIAFDGQQRLHVLWSDPDSPYSDESLKSAIWERVLDGDTWGPNTEVTVYNTDQAISALTLAADDAGGLHLAWSEGLFVDGGHSGLDIYYRSGDGSVWGPEVRIHDSAVSAVEPIVLPGPARVAVLWEEPVEENVLFRDHDVFFSQQVYPVYLPSF